MQAHIGDGIEPVPGSGIEGAEVGHVQASEEILFHIAHAVFHAAFFIAFADIARRNGKAMVRGKVQVFGVEDRGVAHGALQDGGFEVVDHDFVRNAPKEVKGVLMACQKVLHGLGDREFHVQHAAIAQHHDKEAQLSVRLPDRDRAKRAPIHLGTLAGGKGQREKGGLPSGTHRAHIGFDQPIAAGKAVLTQALEDLRGGIGIAFQETDNLRFEWIEFAGVQPGFARAEVVLGQPVGDRAAIEGDGLGDLRGVQSLLCMQVFDLAEAVVVDHANTSQMRANTVLRSTGSSSAAPVEALGVAPLGAASSAKT